MYTHLYFSAYRDHDDLLARLHAFIAQATPKPAGQDVLVIAMSDETRALLGWPAGVMPDIVITDHEIVLRRNVRAN